MTKIYKNQKGFTFVEVLIAIVILVLASVTAADLVRGSVRAVRDAKEFTIATMLLQKTIAELETKMETEGMERGCEKKKDGKFDPPFEKFTWTTYCTEIDFRLSESAAKLLSEKEGDGKETDNKEDMITKMILNMASDYITKSLRELHVEVNWAQGKDKRHIDATTHFVRYDEPLNISALGGIGIGG